MPSFESRTLLIAAYAAFNARSIDAVLETMHPDVDWPNGWEGGRVVGHQAVKDYWTRQWQVVNPRVEPCQFHTDEQGRVVVEVHQLIFDLSGNKLGDERIRHRYTIENGLICQMEILAG
ncbi:nuclear transport factor 2 family protein [Spirosoma sp. SC4-14]|uniref:nuclear transport factor 2 family protein n=1 Tax=Spirosoma sp. SC4-14 TaxID=3128900 RepID=UPI0030CB4566